MDELALVRKKAELQERTIERNHGEMHDVLVRSDETKNHVKRQAEVGYKLLPYKFFELIILDYEQ